MNLPTLVLPYPPSANRYWRKFRNRMVKSKEAAAYSHAVAAACVKAGLRIGRPAFPVGDVAVLLDLYRPAKRGDLDNFAKVALDSLQGFVFADDSQVVDIHFRRFDDKARPRVEVVVEALGAVGVGQ